MKAVVIASLFPAEVGTCAGPIDSFSGILYPEEEAVISRAIAKRRAEFIAGRVCARRALAQMGLPQIAIPAMEDRTPMWPKGFTGSISHSDRYCGAAVARTHEKSGIGLDIELFSRVDIDLLPMICTVDELQFISRTGSAERQRVGAVIFSAKECFYKCQYQLTHAWLGFHDVGVRVEAESSLFRITVVSTAAPLAQGTNFVGKYMCTQDSVFTGMTLCRAAN